MTGKTVLWLVEPFLCSKLYADDLKRRIPKCRRLYKEQELQNVASMFYALQITPFIG